MFAEAGNIDVTNQDHFVMVLCKDSIIDHVCVGRSYLSVFGGGNGCTQGKKKKKRGVANKEPACQTLLVAFRHPHQGLGISFWCAKKAFSIGVLTDTFEDGAHRGCESLLAVRLFSGRGIKAREGGLCFMEGRGQVVEEKDD